MRLEEIRLHPYFPFHDFESNDLSFLLVELYWAELIRMILSGLDGRSYAANWLPAVPADRLDGNPILQIVDRTLSPPRQVRIIQKFNMPRVPEFDLDTLALLRFRGEVHLPFSPSLTYEALDEDGTTPMEELVIFSDISSPCERLNQQFISKWCIERITVSAMEQMLDGYWSIIRANLVNDDPL